MTTSIDQGGTDREQWRRTILEVAAAVAPGWERWRARIEEATAPVREWMIAELAAHAGDTVLELAAGAGDTGFDAAEIVGGHGRVVSTDLSPEMVAVARRRGAERGLRNVEYRVMDAERIELDTDSVDGVLCRFGYMLMADPAAALAQTRRVLRPGGRLALVVWGAPERNPWISILARTLVEGGHTPPPEPAGPTPFSMANEDGTRALLAGAGFTSVRMEEVPVRFTFGTVEEYVSYATDTAGPAAIVLRSVSEDERRMVTSQLERAFTSFAADGGYELPGVALAAVAS